MESGGVTGPSSRRISDGSDKSDESDESDRSDRARHPDDTDS